MAHKTQGKSLLTVADLLHEVLKNAGEKPDDKIHRRGPEGPECRSFCPHEVGLCHPPGRQMCSPTWKLSELCTFGVSMEASLCRHSQSLTQFPKPLPFLEDGARG